MLGIVVQLLLSWVVIWLVEKRNLSVLGLWPTTVRLLHFLLFFSVTAALCASAFFMKMYFGNEQWRLNPALTGQLIFDGIWWNVKSVLFEELIFRGVLLYILIKKAGPQKAILFSAVAFGIYHWFSFGVIGNPVQMVFIFCITAAMGVVLAYAYARTFSLLIPIGIHLGWNLTQTFVFSQGPIGHGILVPLHSTKFQTDSWLIFLTVTFLPMIAALLLNYLLVKRVPQVLPGEVATVSNNS